MMVRHIYCLFDLKSGAFLPPWSATTQGLAYRQLADVVNAAPNPADPVVTHPEDFELYEVAVIDEQTGIVVALDKPNLILRCSELVYVK